MKCRFQGIIVKRYSFAERFPTVRSFQISASELADGRPVAQVQFQEEAPPPPQRKCGNADCRRGVFPIWHFLELPVGLNTADPCLTVRCLGTANGRPCPHRLVLECRFQFQT